MFLYHEKQILGGKDMIGMLNSWRREMNSEIRAKAMALMEEQYREKKARERTSE